MGGETGVRALVDAFYDAMERHEPELAALHQRDALGRIDEASRSNFASFLCYWLGGPGTYLETRGHPRLRMRHAHVPVSSAMKDAWLRSMRAALDACKVDGPVRGFLDHRFAEVADFLRNS